MACPKLENGGCKITKKNCSERYEIKMVKYKDCPVYKKGKPAAKKVAKPKKKARKK